MAQCVNCGANLKPGANRCLKCGSTVEAPPAPGPAPVYAPPPTYAQPVPGAVPPQDVPQLVLGAAKSKIAGGILGILLGHLGIHNFYLGYTGKALGQLLLTVVGVLTSCLGVGVLLCIAAWVWGLIEGIMILTGSINKDAKGVPLV
jgi:TM2 domain-containing membrane protein YozV